MARTTDTERGARIALDASAQRLNQPDLFSDVLTRDDWLAINLAAIRQVNECDWSRDLVRLG